MIVTNGEFNWVTLTVDDVDITTIKLAINVQGHGCFLGLRVAGCDGRPLHVASLKGLVEVFGGGRFQTLEGSDLASYNRAVHGVRGCG